MSDTEYRFTIRPLTKDEGGGYLIEFPDLPGCMSDGETIEEAVANGVDAKRCWIDAMKGAGRPIPSPAVEPAESYSGKWQLRAPKSLHRRLAERAKREGVSLNTLAVTLLAEGLGERPPHVEDSANEAANMKLRSELMIAIQEAVSLWGGAQAEAVKRFAVSEPRLNDLLRGRIGKFSLDELVGLAARAGLRPRLEISGTVDGIAIRDQKPEEYKRLEQIAANLKNSETVEPVTVRELLRWFGAKHRGVHINETIRDALFKNDLHIVPDLNAQHIDSFIEIEEGAVIDEIEEQFHRSYRPLDEGSILNEIEAAMLNKLYVERVCDCLVGWIDRNPQVTEREIRAKAQALNKLGFVELEKEDGAEIIPLPEPPYRTGKIPHVDVRPPHSANDNISKAESRVPTARFERRKRRTA